jgi:hypothetical protein
MSQLGKGITPPTPRRHLESILPLFAAFNLKLCNIIPLLNELFCIDQSMHRLSILRSHIPTMASPSPYSLASTIKLNNGIQMPRIHLGVYMTSGRETTTAVHHALEAGYRAIDSAEWYANEREVGSSVLKSLSTSGLRRADIWFTTKLKTNSSYDATRRAVKESIRKSGLGYIDLYLLHSPYGGKKRRLECWRAVEDAIEEGEVRAGGVSNFGVKHVSTLYPFLSRISADDCPPPSCRNFSRRIRGSYQWLTRSKSILSIRGRISRLSASGTGLWLRRTRRLLAR